VATRQLTGGGVDFKYLEDFAGGDKVVVGEVLSLFLGQAAIWLPRLEPGDDAWADTIHTIKGAARGIGAVRLGDACALAEAEGASGLARVRQELDAATAAIRTYLKA
jgi:HPt (histidine-containing phosphotransfer) domain-containing protein